MGVKMEIVENIINGDQRAAAKLITMAENDFDSAREVLKQLYTYTGKAIVIGVTGPPGSGKSTLVDKLTKKLREKNKTVGIIAVDPTSPFTGGAILGDRIRMQDLYLDKGVFIRSMGTRGHLGGISQGAFAAVKILDAMRKDYVFIETVGVGQSEIDIVKIADTVVLTLVPGLGDDVQAIKAGIMEIADVFAVNKADRDGSDRLVTELEMMLDLNPDKHFRPPVVKTIATENIGIDELLSKILTHVETLKARGEFTKQRQKHVKTEIIELAQERLKRMLLETVWETLDDTAERVLLKEEDPYSAVDRLIENLTSHSCGGV